MVYDEEENLLWIDEPYYDIVQKKHEFRGMERREFIARFGVTAAAILFGLRPSFANAVTSTVNLAGTASGFPASPGEQLYTTAGSYNWTVPTGVSSVCVVCVGPGGQVVSDGSITTSNNVSYSSYFDSNSVVAGYAGRNDSSSPVPGGTFVGDGGGNGGSSGAYSAIGGGGSSGGGVGLFGIGANGAGGYAAGGSAGQAGQGGGGGGGVGGGLG